MAKNRMLPKQRRWCVEWHACAERARSRVCGMWACWALVAALPAYFDRLFLPGTDQRGKSAKILPSSDFPSHHRIAASAFVPPIVRLGCAASAIPEQTLLCRCFFRTLDFPKCGLRESSLIHDFQHVFVQPFFAGGLKRRIHAHECRPSVRASLFLFVTVLAILELGMALFALFICE